MSPSIRIIFGIFLILGLGCNRHLEPETNDLVRSYKLLDAGRNEEAVVLLQSLHDENPKDQKITVALASAYASLAGLQIYAFYDLFYEAMFSRPWAELAKSKAPVTETTIPDIKSTDPKDKSNAASIDKMNRILKAFTGALKAFIQIGSVLERLPTIASENRQYLEQALLLMDSLEKPTKSYAVFRCLLRASYLKHIIATDLSSGLGSQMAQVDDKGQCHFDLIQGASEINSVSQVALKMIGDLTIGFPGDKPTFDKVATALMTGSMSIQTLLAGTTIAAREKKKEIENQIGQVWGCQI